MEHLRQPCTAQAVVGIYRFSGFSLFRASSRLFRFCMRLAVYLLTAWLRDADGTFLENNIGVVKLSAAHNVPLIIHSSILRLG